eukprot:TRINITY_DN1221_c0_g4_i1.p5 TRINITY_DN1221_c0_g4~~TRINITY_DN1221_c0_g4_i1.p5  ORF type:complete len:114 (-),score=6.04 TRINITY_DN1221_c0_g4_i1:533-874(-)
MAMAMTAGAVISEVIESSSVLRLRGLPFEAKENDVHQFFNGFKLLHVHLCRRNGKTTGEAYVQLDSEEETRKQRKDQKSAIDDVIRILICIKGIFQYVHIRQRFQKLNRAVFS